MYLKEFLNNKKNLPPILTLEQWQVPQVQTRQENNKSSS